MVYSNARTHGCGSAEPKPTQCCTTCSLGRRSKHRRVKCRHQHNVPRGVATHGPARCAIEAISERVPLHKAKLANEPDTAGTPHCCPHYPPRRFADWACSASIVGRDRYVLRSTEHVQRGTGPGQREKYKSQYLAQRGVGTTHVNKVLLCETLPFESGVRPERRSASLGDK